MIAAEAGRRWNEQTGFVMDAFLKATEEKQSSLSDPHSGMVYNTIFFLKKKISKFKTNTNYYRTRRFASGCKAYTLKR